MIHFLIPLVASFVQSSFMEYFVIPLFCLYFIGAVPGLIRLFTSWR